MSLGKRLFQLRKKNNYTIKELTSKLSISIQAWSDYEKDRTMPQLEKLITIAKIFNVSLDYLVFGNDCPILPPDIDDMYSSYLECLLILLNKKIINIERPKNLRDKIMFTSDNDYIKSFAYNYLAFIERNGEFLEKDELEEMSKILIKKYSDKIS